MQSGARNAHNSIQLLYNSEQAKVLMWHPVQYSEVRWRVVFLCCSLQCHDAQQLQKVQFWRIQHTFVSAICNIFTVVFAQVLLNCAQCIRLLYNCAVCARTVENCSQRYCRKLCASTVENCARLLWKIVCTCAVENCACRFCGNCAWLLWKGFLMWAECWGSRCCLIFHPSILSHPLILLIFILVSFF